MMTSMADFRASLSGAAPAPDLDAPLAALWWAAKSNWDAAHKIVQDEEDANSARPRSGCIGLPAGLICVGAASPRRFGAGLP
jgi:hypothetical protein